MIGGHRALLGIVVGLVVGCGNGTPSLPTDADSLHGRGEILTERGQFEESVATFTAAINDRPDDPKLFTERGIAHERAGDVEAAEADYTAAIRLDPGHVRALNNRAALRARQSRLEEAIGDLSAVLAVDGRDLLAYQNRSLAAFDLGRFDDAMADLDAADRLSPGNPIHAFRRGRIALAAGDFEAAVGYYDDAIRLGQSVEVAAVDRALIFAERGDALREIGRFDDAAQSFDEAAALDPSLGTGTDARAARSLAMAAEFVEAAGYRVSLKDGQLAATNDSGEYRVITVDADNDGSFVLSAEDHDGIASNDRVLVVLRTAEGGRLLTANDVRRLEKRPSSYRFQ